LANAIEGAGIYRGGFVRACVQEHPNLTGQRAVRACTNAFCTGPWIFSSSATVVRVTFSLAALMLSARWPALARVCAGLVAHAGEPVTGLPLVFGKFQACTGTNGVPLAWPSWFP
jgi:hypothetical protein